MRKLYLVAFVLLFVSSLFAGNNILEYIPSNGKMPVVLNRELLTVKDVDFSGKVFVKMAVDEKGKVIVGKVNILSPVKNESVKKAVSNVVKQISFSPAIVDNKPVKCWVTLPIKFTSKTKIVQY